MTGTAGGHPLTSSQNERQTLIAVEEQVSVNKREQVIGTVHARTLSDEHEQPVEADLLVETLEVERLPIGRFVDGPIPDRQEGDTTIISVIEEVATVVVHLKLVEEVRITRRTTSRKLTDKVMVRRQQVVVDQEPAPGDSAP
jgi:stress response protein YsnF